MFEYLFKFRKKYEKESLGENIAKLRTQEVHIKFMNTALGALLNQTNHIWEPTIAAEQAALYAKCAMIELKKLSEDFENYGKAKRSKEATCA